MCLAKAHSKSHVTGSCALPASFAIIVRKYSVKKINNIEISKEKVTGLIVIIVLYHKCNNDFGY